MPTKNNLGSSRIVAGWLWIHLRRARTGARETVLPCNHSQLQVPSVRQDLNTALPSGRGEQAALDQTLANYDSLMPSERVSSSERKGARAYNSMRPSNNKRFPTSDDCNKDA